MFHCWIKNFKNTYNFQNARIVIWIICVENFSNAQIFWFKLIVCWSIYGSDADVNSWKWLKKRLGRREVTLGLAEDWNVENFISKLEFEGISAFRVLKTVHFRSVESLDGETLMKCIISKCNCKKVYDRAHGWARPIFI